MGQDEFRLLNPVEFRRISVRTLFDINILDITYPYSPPKLNNDRSGTEQGSFWAWVGTLGGWFWHFASSFRNFRSRFFLLFPISHPLRSSVKGWRKFGKTHVVFPKKGAQFASAIVSIKGCKGRGCRGGEDGNGMSDSAGTRWQAFPELCRIDVIASLVVDWHFSLLRQATRGKNWVYGRYIVVSMGVDGAVIRICSR